MTRAKLEVHEHAWVTGPRSRFVGQKLVHSHGGGDVAHEHEHTGPSCYTICRKQWLKKTGLVGGGRKRFTASPTGEQLPQRNLTEEELTYDLVVVGPPGQGGPGVALPLHLAMAFGMKAEVRQ